MKKSIQRKATGKANIQFTGATCCCIELFILCMYSLMVLKFKCLKQEIRCIGSILKSVIFFSENLLVKTTVYIEYLISHTHLYEYINDAFTRKGAVF